MMPRRSFKESFMLPSDPGTVPSNSGLELLIFMPVTSYRIQVFQVRVNFERNAQKREAMWEKQHQLAADKIYNMCTALGGFFLKIAQIVGKPDLAPAAWVKRLVTLCDQAPATQFDAIKVVLEEELGQSFRELFERFDEDPLGSASIAQVHRARLKGHRSDVVVKIQHPDIHELMMTDIRNMQAFAFYLQKTDIAFDLYSVTKEIEKQIGYEFNFRREADAMERIQHFLNENNKKSPVVVPRLIRNMVSRRVLVMEYIDGIPILNLGEEIAKRGINPVGKVAAAAKQNILKSLALAYGQMILRSGFFHADPHPGNILICKGSEVALLDYGQVKDLPEKLRLGYASLVLAIADDDPIKAAVSYRELGIDTLSKCEDEREEMLKLARSMFDTKLPPGVATLQPFSEDSSIKKIAVQAFPEELFSVLRTVQLLRGLSVGLGIDYSCAEQWRPIAEEALYAAGRLTNKDVKGTQRGRIQKNTCKIIDNSEQENWHRKILYNLSLPFKWSFQALCCATRGTKIFESETSCLCHMAYSYSSHDSLNERRNFLVSGFPILEDAAAAIWFPSFYNEPGEFKRLKRTTSFGDSFSDSISSGSSIPRISNTSHLSSTKKPQFRDHISMFNQRYLAAEAVEEAARAIIKTEDGGATREDGNGDGMKLVQQLISCAEAVACRDKSHASLLLSELRANALVFGTSFQRVASCFVQGLADRLTLVQPLGTVGYVAPRMNIMDIDSEKKEEALRLVYEICPYIQFGHFVANFSILEAFEGESLVHIVDLGMSLGLPHGQQWHSLIHSLAKRPGTPPHLRITAVGLCTDKFLAIGEELETYAVGLGLSLDFSIVQSSLENLKPEDIKVLPSEALVVNSILQLHCVVKESRGALNSVLQVIHELSPKVLVLVEQDSSHNGPFFLGRFMEALHYYSAIFDSLDAMLPKYDTKRAKMEQFYFAEEIKNIVSCEGPARVERHERVDQWRRRMSRAGFQPLPLKLLAQAKQWLSSINACEGYTIVEEKGCLVLGWKSKPIVAASCWKC